MTSGSILPTFGAAPPNIRRAVIPRELQPDIPSAADALQRRPEPPVPEEQETAPRDDDQPGFGRPIAVADATAFADDGDSDAADAPLPPPKPPTAPPSSEASRRVERAIEAAAAPDESVNAQGLTEEEQAYVRELQEIDREVRAHEAAHAATGGAYAGRPTYEYVTGPDGVRYAVSGRVQIDTGVVSGDPEATIRKLETVRRSALAPAKPSGQDRAVAAQAEAGIRQAQAELNEQRAEEAEARASGEPSEARGDFAGNRTDTPSVSEQIAENDAGTSGSGDAGSSFAINPDAQAAFSQAALTQSAVFGEQGTGEPRLSVDLLA